MNGLGLCCLTDSRLVNYRGDFQPGHESLCKQCRFVGTEIPLSESDLWNIPLCFWPRAIILSNPEVGQFQFVEILT